jgi:hypothetical protein
LRLLLGVTVGAVTAIALTAGAWYFLASVGLINDPCKGAEVYGEIILNHCLTRDGVARGIDQFLLVTAIFVASVIGGWVASRISRSRHILTGALAILPIQVIGAIPLFLDGHRYLYSWLDWYFLGIAIIPGVLGGLLARGAPSDKSLEGAREG